jgi:hypothetical protein
VIALQLRDSRQLILDDEAGLEEQAVCGTVGLGEIGRTGNWEIGKVQGP